MTTGRPTAALAALALIGTAPAIAQHWGYEGEGAPANWSRLDPKFALCGTGRNQSPIGLARFVAADLKPLKYYRFNGSLTTPPCSEGVWWLVMKQAATASKAQVEQFAKAVGFANNRPVQPVYARPVLR